MQDLFRFLAILYFITSSLSGLWSQQSVHTAGGDASGLGGSVSYSIGQVAYTSVSSDDGQVSQGVQQSNLVIMVGQNEPDPEITIGFYPNPVQDEAFLQLAQGHNEIGSQRLLFLMYTMYGTLIQQKEIVRETTIVPMDNFPEGMYILKVVRNHATIKTFKVVKTN
jgi:hypothetical protein